MTIGIYEAVKEAISNIPLEPTADDTTRCACGLMLVPAHGFCSHSLTTVTSKTRIYCQSLRSRDIFVFTCPSDWATGRTVRGSNPGRPKIFFVFQNVQTKQWGPSSLQFNKCRGSFAGVKRPGLEVDHSPPSSCRFKNE
jgi:hypothetical protein